MINSLTSFRFITALFVFLFHCKIHFGFFTEIRFIDKFIGNGAVFMTGFFVLSGFIMMHVYHSADFTKQRNIFDFYKKRFARIYPTYTFVTLFYFAIFPPAQPFRILFSDAFLVQAFIPGMFDIGINGATWSLSVEMFFYLLFPFLTLICTRAAPVMFIALLITTIVSINSTSYNLYSNPFFRLGDFLFGMGAYLLCQHIKFKENLHFIFFIILVVSVRSIGGGVFMRGQYLFAPLFALWICSVYFSKSKIYNNDLMVFLGKISYSFYLWQFVAMEVGKEFLFLNNYLLILGAFLLNLLLATMSYYLIEEPMRKMFVCKDFEKTVIRLKKYI